jgi:hypothetical protein
MVFEIEIETKGITQLTCKGMYVRGTIRCTELIIPASFIVRKYTNYSVHRIRIGRHGLATQWTHN